MFTSYTIFALILLAFTFAIVIMFAVMLLKKKNTNITTDAASARIQYIMFSPLRPTMIGFAFMFIGVIFSYLIFSGFQIPPDFTQSYTYISIVMGIAGIGMLLLGLYIFLRRNTLIQLKLHPEGMYYCDIDWTPSRQRNVFGIFLKKPVKHIPYSDITEIVIKPDAMYGDSLYIHQKRGSGFYLPYIGDHKQNIQEVQQLIQQRMM